MLQLTAIAAVLRTLPFDALTRRVERLAAYASADIPIETRFAEDASAFAHEILRRKHLQRDVSQDAPGQNEIAA